MIEMKLLFAKLAKLQHGVQCNGIWHSFLVFDALLEANNFNFLRNFHQVVRKAIDHLIFFYCFIVTCSLLT